MAASSSLSWRVDAAMSTATPSSASAEASLAATATDTPGSNVVLDVNSFRCADTITAAKDLRVQGAVVVRKGCWGYVVGPASSAGRVCVQFEVRQDQSDNRLNCLPDELRLALPGGYQMGARVVAARQLQSPRGVTINPGAPGLIAGLSRDNSAGNRDLLVHFLLGNGASAEAVACGLEDIEAAIAGNLRRGNAVIAVRDLRVGGTVVVREGVLGTVVGPSHTDSQNRITVAFSHREDGSRNHLNCILNEIRLYLPQGLDVCARVQVTRTISSSDGHPPVHVGSHGIVLGPALDEPLARVLVRFGTSTGQTVDREIWADDLKLIIAGGFRRGESVSAAKDLRVKGAVVVKQGVAGTVVGQSSSDPSGRVTVAFARREDNLSNNLNVVPGEIHRLPCTGGLVPGDRVAALRQLLVVPRGSYGSVLGPSCAQSTRVAVKFTNAEDTEEVILHVEPEDLKALNTCGEDVDDSGPDVPFEELTDDTTSNVSAGFNRGETVAATRDLRVGGKLAVRANVLGTVVGTCANDSGRVTITFAWREDQNTNNLNVQTCEIRKVDIKSLAQGELCAICLGELVTEPETRGEEMCRMTCGHVLHMHCVKAYLKHQTLGNKSSGSDCLVSLTPLKPAQCPVCRRDVLP